MEVPAELLSAMSSEFKELTKDVTSACKLAIGATPGCATSDNLDDYSESPKVAYYDMVKTKHGGSFYTLRTITDFLDVLSFLKNNIIRKTIAADAILVMQNVPGACISWYYLDDEGDINIFHVPIISKLCTNQLIQLKMTEYKISDSGWYRNLRSLDFNPGQHNPHGQIKIKTNMGVNNLYKCPKTGLPYAPCRVCKEAVKTWRCSGCNLVNYCSKECQKKDWKTHKAICKNVGGAFPRRHIIMSNREDG